MTQPTFPENYVITLSDVMQAFMKLHNEKVGGDEIQGLKRYIEAVQTTNRRIAAVVLTTEKDR